MRITKQQENSSARILDAALQLFSQYGYEGTSTREICELAGITKPTLYYFFESKEGVYRALVEKAFQEYASIVESALSAGTLREKLRRLAQQMFERTSDNPQLGRFLFSIVYSINSPFVQQVQSSHQNLIDRVQQAVSAAVKTGEISPGDFEVRATVLNGALVEALSNHLITGTPKLTRKFAHSIIDTVLDGWGK
ncbi:MAG TPA: TetR/AcrR family transcriptional regulator [Terriglobales bacterium]